MTGVKSDGYDCVILKSSEWILSNNWVFKLGLALFSIIH